MKIEKYDSNNGVKSLIIKAILLLLVVFAGSCSKDESPSTAITLSLSVISGENQTARIEDVLPNPIEIELMDQNGNPFAGATVNFEIKEGSLSNETAISNTEGKVLVTWTLGDNTGVQILAVTSEEVKAPLLVNATGTLEKGDFYKGGIVFYIDDSKKHGFVCALKDQSKAAQWGCLGTEIDGANSTSPEAGKQNTIDIEKGCATAGTAADLCANLSSNGFSDWFLPGREMVVQLANNSSIISKGAKENGGAGFSTGRYWSSSEFNSDQAYRMQLPVGGRRPLPKNSLFGVRAIRAF